MNNVKITLTIVNDLGITTVIESETKIDADVSQVIKFDYLSANDGGPLMRPNNPPR